MAPRTPATSLRPPRRPTLGASWVLLACLLSLAGAGAARDAGAAALTPRVGTTGVGLDLTVGLAPAVNLRMGAGGGLSHDEARTVDDIDYEATLDVATAQALLDWHPGGGGFRLSIGGAWNGNEIEGRARAEENAVYEIGDVVFPAAVVGEIDGRVEFDALAPYVGIGWGNGAAASPGWSLAFDLGVLYHGEPDIDLVADLPPGSPIETIPGARALFDAELAKEEARAQDDIEAYRWFPVLTLGVSYRF